MNYLDIAILVILIFTILMGIRDGIWVQFFALFGVVVNFFLAKKFTPNVLEVCKPVLVDKLGFNMINKGEVTNTLDKFRFDILDWGVETICYLIVFIITYIGICFIVKMIRGMLKKQRKGIVSRILGGVFGALKGGLLSFVLLLVVNIFGIKYTALQNVAKESVINNWYINNTEYLKSCVSQGLESAVSYINSKQEIENSGRLK